MGKSPYDNAPDRSFWSRAVSGKFQAEDLMAPGAVLLRRNDRVASAGSCFAANMVPFLERAGFVYVRTEVRHPSLRVPPENLSYDNFSAAYGNIYTARQLLQMFYRSIGRWEPRERMWEDAGTYIDPFRPGLRYRARSVREFDLLTSQHLSCVRRMLVEANVFVFTLGLTEAWISRDDGAVFPACPGTIAGTFDPDRHAFHNMTASEVTSDLNEFIYEVRKLNRNLRIIITVSPVPLVATATGRHVLEATVYSKSVLRVAASEVESANVDTLYFPAYEIVTGPQAAAGTFEADRRNVSKAAIETVMAAFIARCETDAAGRRSAVASAPATAPLQSPRPREPVPIRAIAPTHGAAAPVSAAQQAAASPRQDLSAFIVDAECEEAMADPRRPGDVAR